VGAVVVARELSDQFDGNGSAEPTPTPLAPVPTSTPTRPRPRATPTPNDCPQCDPDLTPPPIRSPFPPDQLPAHQARSLRVETPPPVAAAHRLSPFE
jgi:hypothetical protein